MSNIELHMVWICFRPYGILLSGIQTGLLEYTTNVRCGGSERGRTKWYRKTTNREKPLEGYLPLQISTWPQGRQPTSITVNGWLHSTRLLSRHTFSLLRNWFHILWSPVSQWVSCGWQRHLSRAKVLPRNFHPNRASSKNIVNLCI